MDRFNQIVKEFTDQSVFNYHAQQNHDELRQYPLRRNDAEPGVSKRIAIKLKKSNATCRWTDQRAAERAGAKRQSGWKLRRKNPRSRFRPKWKKSRSRQSR